MMVLCTVGDLLVMVGTGFALGMFVGPFVALRYMGLGCG